MNPSPEELLSESVLAGRLGINRSRFAEWRKSGDLLPDEHYLTRGRGEVLLTRDGCARVAELLGHDDLASLAAQPATVPVLKIAVKVTEASVNPRVVRGIVLATGRRCSVRLLTPRVFASQFHYGAQIQAVATVTDGVLEYEGKAPVKMRL